MSSPPIKGPDHSYISYSADVVNKSSKHHPPKVDGCFIINKYMYKDPYIIT